MSTICQIGITAPIDVVALALEEILRTRGIGFHRAESEWPLASKPDTFLASDCFPSIFSVQPATPVVTEIAFNSFSRLSELVAPLSATANSRAVVNIYQSVSAASYWAFYDHGREMRTIEASEGAVQAHTGNRLPFEALEPGRAAREGDHVMFFDSDELDWYNSEVGVPLQVYRESATGWVNFVLDTRRPKPWWKLW